MTYDKTNMSADEYRQHKESLRQKAYEAELNRLKKSKNNQQKLVLFSLLFAAIMLILLLIVWFYPTNSEEIGEPQAIITVHDTVHTNSDTIYIEKIISKEPVVNFYTVQIGAYKKQEMPISLTNAYQFPVIQYQYNNLNCFAFGQFPSIEKAEEARNFLKKIGFSNTVIVKISNNKRVALIK